MRIVPVDNGNRGIIWWHKGQMFGLAYNPRRLFGKRLRQIRQHLLMSVQCTMETQNEAR